MKSIEAYREEYAEALRELRKKHRHVWTPVALEEGEGPRLMWHWCIRCGALKLGYQIFAPGLKQKKAVLETQA